MVKYIFKLLMLCLPFLALFLEPFISLSTFTFRPHESLLYYHSGAGMPFYPNHRLFMKSEGDLCANTEYAVKKDELWLTDHLGYRNNEYVFDPDVLIIGDSFILGTSISQDSTLTNLLSGRLSGKLEIYNLAPATFHDFVSLLEGKALSKPEVIIFSLGEREIPPELDVNNIESMYENSRVTEWINKMKRVYAINFIRSRLFPKKDKSVQSEVNESMFFLNGKKQWDNLEKIDSVLKAIETYKMFCDSLDIDLLVMPLPNKETVYHELVPLAKQPEYLYILDKELKKREIFSFNTLELFNQYRKGNPSMIYHLDDTHWNGTGVNLVAEEIAKIIMANPGIASRIYE